MRNNAERLAKLANHLAENPRDYQSLISFYKLRSDEYEYLNKAEMEKRLQLIAKCKKRLRENEERISEQ